MGWKWSFEDESAISVRAVCRVHGGMSSQHGDTRIHLCGAVPSGVLQRDVLGACRDGGESWVRSTTSSCARDQVTGQKGESEVHTSGFCAEGCRRLLSRSATSQRTPDRDRHGKNQ